ncbi:MAG: hypothetical protein KAT01_03110 [Candidatus Aminicenantes bacterium]|nr:hypothetical protein [Candidatus Aminicenantes bacterium]
MSRVLSMFVVVFVMTGIGFPDNPSILTDIDGNTYKTVKIGGQIWMIENLRVTRDPDGNPITSYCYGDKEDNCTKYGRLYPFEEALKACPKGWHLPSRAECQALFAYLGGEEIAGGKLKEGGSSGFEALIAGGRSYRGTFDSLGVYGSFWSSEEESEKKAWHFGVNVRDSRVGWYPGYKAGSVSVRYIKDK